MEHLKVEEDDKIVIKDEVFGEDEANQSGEYIDVDVSNLGRQCKSYSLPTGDTLLSQESYELCNSKMGRRELENDCDVVNKINPLVSSNMDSFDTYPKQILECQQDYRVSSEEVKSEERICRLCFKMCDQFKTIDGDTKNDLDVVLTGIDLSAVQEPVMCTLCTEMLFQCVDFKVRCLNTHKYLVPFVNKGNNVKLNLKDIYITKNNDGVRNDKSICGFCMSQVRNRSVIFIDIDERDISVKETIERCLPESNLSNIEEPVICAPCHSSLVKLSILVMNVLMVEEKIRKYKETLKISSETHVDLSSIFQFAISEVNGNRGNMMKLEKMSGVHSESVDEEVENKYNSSVDIGDPIFNNEQAFAPRNMLNGEVERNEIEAVEEDRIKFKEENIVEVEDQKILFDEGINIKTDELNFNSFEDGKAMTQLNTMFDEKQECSVEDNQLRPHTEQVFMEKNVAKITYPCKCCSFQTQNKYYLEKHLLMHQDRSEMTIYKCDSCSFQTRYKSCLNIHLLRHKDLFEVIMHKCHFCTYQTKHKKIFRKHLMKHENRKVYKCDSCFYQTTYIGIFKKHLVKHKDISEVTAYNCDLCSFRSKYKSALKKHLHKHERPEVKHPEVKRREVKIFKCDSCLYETKHKSALKKHVLKHRESSKVEMYKCDTCLFGTKYKPSLVKHMLGHKSLSQVEMYKCDSCGYQTIHKGYLTKHFLVHKQPSELTMYKCDVCLYRTKYKYELKKHSLKHSNPSEIPIYKCDSCSFQTMHKGCLPGHNLIHKKSSELPMYKCDSCTFQTKQKSCLKRHAIIHKDTSEVTMYKCDFCSHQTKHERCLKTHILIHKELSELTMYKCGLCPYQTKYKGNLKSHNLKHKGLSELSMYKCHTCSFQAKQKGDLKKHILTHRKPSEVIYNCKVCSYQTKSVPRYKIHVLKHKRLSEVPVV